jgi:hypothetical protein
MTIDDFLELNESSLVAQSAEQTFELIGARGRLGGPFYYYRGVSSAAHRLVTSLDRTLRDEDERRRRWREQFLVEQFMKLAHNHIAPSSLPASTFEWRSLMQHHGIPTRLLDVTRSPYVALYFAVRDWDDPSDAALWAFGPSRLHDLAMNRLRRDGFPMALPVRHVYHLRQFVTDEYFHEVFITGKYRIVTILEPHWADPRLASQQGAFLLASSVSTCLEDSLVDAVTDVSDMDPREVEFLRRNSKDWSIVKLTIPHSLKRKVFLELRRMNIHAGTLFPDLEGAARSITELRANDEFLDMTWQVAYDFWRTPTGGEAPLTPP